MTSVMQASGIFKGFLAVEKKGEICTYASMFTIHSSVQAGLAVVCFFGVLSFIVGVCWRGHFSMPVWETREGKKKQWIGWC